MSFMRVMNLQRSRAVAIAVALIVADVGVSRAQGETDSAKAVRHSAAEANLAKAAQNPVANMVSLPLQWNYSTKKKEDLVAARKKKS